MGEAGGGRKGINGRGTGAADHQVDDMRRKINVATSISGWKGKRSGVTYEASLERRLLALQ